MIKPSWKKRESPNKAIFAAEILLLVITAILMIAGQAHAEEPEKIEIQNELHASGFELPLDGATGYAVAAANMRAGPSSKSEKLGTIPAGGMFVIHEDCGQYMRISYENTQGYAVKSLVMVNLPDIIPSMKYVDSNATASLFKSSGYDLKNITGQSLYTGKTWNERLGYEEFNMPVLYTMAVDICKAQQAALADGNTIMLYEGYRPVKVQKLVNVELANLMAENKTVRSNINDGTWGKNWFIAKSLSNHQMGFAVDVSLAQVTDTKTLELGEYTLTVPNETQELNMPTAMHELSNKAAALAWPVNSLSKTAWTKIPNAKSMTDAAKTLKSYFTTNNMSPLASEWWHFNHLDARTDLRNTAKCSGQFEITGNCSQKVSS